MLSNVRELQLSELLFHLLRIVVIRFKFINKYFLDNSSQQGDDNFVDYGEIVVDLYYIVID